MARLLDLVTRLEPRKPRQIHSRHGRIPEDARHVVWVLAEAGPEPMATEGRAHPRQRAPKEYCGMVGRQPGGPLRHNNAPLARGRRGVGGAAHAQRIAHTKGTARLGRLVFETSAGTSPRQRLSRGHRALGKQRWDEAIQQKVLTEAELPWQDVTENRDKLVSLELKFLDRVLRQTKGHRECRLHAGRWFAQGDHQHPDAAL